MNIKHTIIVFILFISSTVKAGGWDPYYYKEFYNIFNQEMISNSSYYPFLGDKFSRFYRVDDNKLYNHIGNIKLWQEIIPSKSANEIYNLVIDNNQNYGYYLLKGNHLSSNILLYLTFADECNDKISKRKNYNSWDTYVSNGNTKLDYLIKKALSLYNAEENIQIKSRYAYQIVRLMHYAGRPDEAISFFDSNIKYLQLKNEIYYYTLDHVAGCYYSLKDYEKSAYLFLKVFNKSEDRKQSSFNSYRFCLGSGADGNTYFKNKEDKNIHTTIKSLMSFSDGYSGMKELYRKSPNDEGFELLFAREVYKLEIKNFTERSVDVKVNELLIISEQMCSSSSVKNKDFWFEASSYLSFLNNDVTSAKRKLLSISDRYMEQKDILSKVYEVSTWKHMDIIKEKYLANIISVEDINVYKLRDDWKLYIIDKVASLYLKNNSTAKYYLLTSYISSIDQNGSDVFIEDLIRLNNKKNKNNFEKILLSKLSLVVGDVSRKDILYYSKAMYLFKDYKLEEALKYFELIENKDAVDWSYKFNRYIPSTIFSNNIKECFSCDQNIIMVDKMYLDNNFSFIKNKSSIIDITRYLIELNQLASSKDFIVSSLSNYMLGNFYYNISDAGYYRDIIYAEGNGWSSHHLSNDNINIYRIDKVKGKQFRNQNKAYNYYSKILKTSADRELKAKTLYMMSKCELEDMYFNELRDVYTGSKWRGDYEGILNETTSKYKKSFKILKRDYSETQYYKEIINECSFFEYYSSH